MIEEQTTSLRQRTRTDPERTPLSKYGASREPPKDDAVFYPEDDTHSFFARVKYQNVVSVTLVHMVYYFIQASILT